MATQSPTNTCVQSAAGSPLHARRQAAKRAEILAIATKIFLEEGYGRASMDQVHARIRGSKRTLYNYFPSKEELFKAIVTNLSDRVLAALRPDLEQADPRAMLRKMGTDYLNVLLSPDGLALYRAMVSEAPHFPELARTFFENGPGRASHHLAAFFREHKTGGAINVEDPQLAAEQFLGMVRGTSTWPPCSPRKAPPSGSSKRRSAMPSRPSSAALYRATMSGEAVQAELVEPSGGWADGALMLGGAGAAAAGEPRGATRQIPAGSAANRCTGHPIDRGRSGRI